MRKPNWKASCALYRQVHLHAPQVPIRPPHDHSVVRVPSTKMLRRPHQAQVLPKVATVGDGHCQTDGSMWVHSCVSGNLLVWMHVKQGGHSQQNLVVLRPSWPAGHADRRWKRFLIQLGSEFRVMHTW